VSDITGLQLRRPVPDVADPEKPMRKSTADRISQDPKNLFYFKGLWWFLLSFSAKNTFKPFGYSL